MNITRENFKDLADWITATLENENIITKESYNNTRMMIDESIMDWYSEVQTEYAYGKHQRLSSEYFDNEESDMNI